MIFIKIYLLEELLRLLLLRLLLPEREAELRLLLERLFDTEELLRPELLRETEGVLLLLLLRDTFGVLLELLLREIVDLLLLFGALR